MANRCGKHGAMIDGKCVKNIIPMDVIRQKNEEAGHYFFKPKTMRFFKSKIESSYAFISKDGKNAYFITSEKPPHDSREFKVREVNLKTWDTHTARQINREHMSRREAWEELDKITEE